MSRLCPACETYIDVPAGSTLIPQHQIGIWLGAPACPASFKNLDEAREQAGVVQMLDAMRKLRVALHLAEQDPAPPTQIRAHPWAVEYLLRHVATRTAQPWQPPAVDAVYGIPLVTDDQLAHGAWVALDRAGNVLATGVMVDADQPPGADSPSTAHPTTGAHG